MKSRKDLKTFAEILKLLRDAERLAIVGLSSPARRGVSMGIALNDLGRALEGFEEAHRTEHVHVTGELPGEETK
jgi:hypothetical protein